MNIQSSRYKTLQPSLSASTFPIHFPFDRFEFHGRDDSDACPGYRSKNSRRSISRGHPSISNYFPSYLTVLNSLLWEYENTLMFILQWECDRMFSNFPHMLFDNKYLSSTSFARLPKKGKLQPPCKLLQVIKEFTFLWVRVIPEWRILRVISSLGHLDLFLPIWIVGTVYHAL